MELVKTLDGQNEDAYGLTFVLIKILGWNELDSEIVGYKITRRGIILCHPPCSERTGKLWRKEDGVARFKDNLGNRIDAHGSFAVERISIARSILIFDRQRGSRSALYDFGKTMYRILITWTGSDEE